MLKVVFDSTTLVSAFLRKDGVTGKLLERAVQGEFELYLADAIIEETMKKVHRLRRMERGVACYAPFLLCRLQTRAVYEPPPLPHNLFFVFIAAIR